MTALKATARAPIVGKALAQQADERPLFSDDEVQQRALLLPESPLFAEARAAGIEVAEYIDGSGELDEDELRADLKARKRAAGKLITCRACGLRRPAAYMGVLLCPECAADPTATEATIADIVARAEAAFQTAHERLDALIAQADERTRERWGRAHAALMACSGLPGERLARDLQATRELGDALSEILIAHDAVLAAAGSLDQVRRQARQARAELDALEGVI